MSDEYQKRLKQVDDYLLEKLPEKEVEAFEIFLFGSPELLQEVKIREQMIKLIKAERQELLADYRHRKSSSIIVSIKEFFLQPQPNWAYVGVVAAILIAAFFIPKLFLVEKDPAFAVNRSLEPYLGESRRSVGNFSEVTILSPEMGQEFDRNILFQWTVKRDDQLYEGRLDLKVLNNKEEVVQTQQVLGKDSVEIKIPRAGLYYWTLEHQGEMLYLGKFLVKLPGD